MSDLATLGLVVDGSGARREIKLTREELMALANGGKEAAAVLKTAVPTTIAPPEIPRRIDNVTAALQRMRQAAAQGADASLARQIAANDPFIKIAASAQVAAQRVDGLRSSLQKMQANAMASQIAALDPFQNAGQNAVKAGLNFNRVRESLTQLAVASGALPGPIGRVASALAPLAFGSQVTVGVLAGLAAIGYAYNKLTEDSRKAREELEKQLDVLRQLKRAQDLGPVGETGPATDAARKRAEEIRAQLSGMNAAIAQAQLAPPGAFDLAGALKDRRRALIQEYVGLQGLVAAGEKEIARIKQEEADKQAAEEDRRAAERQRRIERTFQMENDELARQRQIREKMVDFLVGRALGEGDPVEHLADERLKQVRETGSVQHDIAEQQKRDLDQIIEKMREELGLTKDKAAELERARRAREEVIFSGMAGIAGGFLSAGGGPGGAIAAGALAGIGGGAPGIAFGALQGLTSSLLSLAQGAEQARQAQERLRDAYQAFIDSQLLALGDISETEARRRDVARQFDEQRRQKRVGETELPDDFFSRYQAQLSGYATVEQYNAEVRRLNELEQRRLEQLGLEAEKIERLNTALRNAPSGFYLEKYIRDVVGPGAAVPLTAIPGGVVDRYAPTTGGTKITVNTMVVQLPPGTPEEQFKTFVKILDGKAASIGGAGSSRSAALDRLN